MANNSTWRKMLGMEQEPAARPHVPMVFITGCMRSGTSFLLGKLTRHPQLLQIGTELNEVWTDIGGAPCLDQCQYRSEQHANSQYAINMAAYFTQYVANARKLKRHLMRWRRSKRDQSGRVVYDWDHVRGVNKCTHLTNKTRYVQALFPNARWIIIVRDIYGNAASTKMFFDRIFKQTGEKFGIAHGQGDCWNRHAGTESRKLYPGDFSAIPEMWLRLNHQLFQDLAHLDPTSFVVVRYEDLVRNQEAVINHIWSHLQLRPEHQHEAQRIAGSAMKIINTSTPGDPLVKWKRNLTESEQQVIQAMIEQHQEQYDWINDQVQLHVNRYAV